MPRRTKLKIIFYVITGDVPERDETYGEDARPDVGPSNVPQSPNQPNTDPNNPNQNVEAGPANVAQSPPQPGAIPVSTSDQPPTVGDQDPPPAPGQPTPEPDTFSGISPDSQNANPPTCRLTCPAPAEQPRPMSPAGTVRAKISPMPDLTFNFRSRSSDLRPEQNWTLTTRPVS